MELKSNRLPPITLQVFRMLHLSEYYEGKEEEVVKNENETFMEAKRLFESLKFPTAPKRHGFSIEKLTKNGQSDYNLRVKRDESILRNTTVNK